MEHLQSKQHFESEEQADQAAAKAYTPLSFEDQQILFLSKSCSALIEEDDKYMVLTSMMAVFNIDWYTFRDWYTERYIGK